MQLSRHPARRPPRTAAGFTLIELLVVIVVIGILAALLIPAINVGVSRAREAEVVAELSAIDAAMVNFKSKYGVEVPSFIVLAETGALWDADWDMSPPVAGITNVHRRTSKAFVRQAWADFDFGRNRDINGDGDSGDTLVLNGAECLAFFLGGVCETNVVDNTGAVKPTAAVGDPITWWNPLGFAANPQDPFARGGNRVAPFLQFEGGPTGRLRDFFQAADEGMPEYFDPLSGQTRPYLYLSSYGGRGYQQYGADYDPSVPSGVGTADDEMPLNPSPPPPNVMSIYFSDSGLTTPHNPQTYQIISPGFDFEYGTGGHYNGETVGARTNERDNITNFKKGRLN